MKNNLIVHSITISVFIFISFFWEKINLPIINNDDVVGYLTYEDYNPNTDTLRYLLIILLPLLIFYFINSYFKKKEKINFLDLFNNKKFEIKDFNFRNVKFLFFFLISITIFDYVNNFPFYHLKLDILHDGDYLAPAQNFLLKGGIFFNNLSVHGASNTIYPIIGWKIFGNETIGSYRVFLSLLVLLLKITSIFLAFELTKISSLNFQLKIISFTSLSLIFISLSSYNLPLNYSSLSIRDLYVVIFLILLIHSILHKFNLIILIFLSLVPLISLILHIDIGFYLYFIFFIYLAYVLIQKNYLNFYICVISNIIFFFIFFLIIGKIEFINFFKNLIVIVNNIDLIHGLRFPQPIFGMDDNPHSARATKTLLMQLIAGMLVVYFVFFKKDLYENKQKIILLFIFILSFIMFKNALGRSDSYHIRMSSDWPTIILAFFILEYLLGYFQEKNYLNKFGIKFIPIFLIMIFFIYNFEKNKINDIKYFKSNIINYINHDDKKFLNKKSENFLLFLKKNLKNNECIANFTFDLSIVYLVKKSSCTRFIAPYLASGKTLEKKFISQIKDSDPKLIIYQSPINALDTIPMSKRLKTVNDYITQNYENFYSENDYVVLKKR